MQCHGGSSDLCTSDETVTKSSAVDCDHSDLHPMVFRNEEKLPTTTKSKVGSVSHRNYGATSTFSQSEQQPDLLSCRPQHHRQIRRVFQVNIIRKYLESRNEIGEMGLTGN